MGQALICSIFPAKQDCYYPHFAAEENDAQRNLGTLIRIPQLMVAELGCEARTSDSALQCCPHPVGQEWAAHSHCLQSTEPGGDETRPEGSGIQDQVCEGPCRGPDNRLCTWKAGSRQRELCGIRKRSHWSWAGGILGWVRGSDWGAAPSL